MRVFELNVGSNKSILREVDSLLEAENLISGMSYMQCTPIVCENINEAIMVIVNDDFTAFATEDEHNEQRNVLAEKIINDGSYIFCDAIVCKIRCDEEDDHLIDLTDDDINLILNLI